MLQGHDSYKQVWQKQMRKSIEARDQLNGKINKDHQEVDLTITEKLDGQYNTKENIKNVLSKSFEQNSDQQIRNGWISSLRTRTEGNGSDMRNICCEKMEETIASPMLGPNKRTYLRNSSRQGAVTQVKDSEKAYTTLQPGRDFIIECTQKDKQHVKRRYAFPVSKSTKTSKANFLPSKSEIPVFDI